MNPRTRTIAISLPAVDILKKNETRVVMHGSLITKRMKGLTMMGFALLDAIPPPQPWLEHYSTSLST